jgi:hypothetical protein
MIKPSVLFLIPTLNMLEETIRDEVVDMSKYGKVSVSWGLSQELNEFHQTSLKEKDTESVLFLIPRFLYWPEEYYIGMTQSLGHWINMSEMLTGVRPEIILPDDPAKVRRMYHQAEWLDSFQTYGIPTPQSYKNIGIDDLPEWENGYVVRGYWSSAKMWSHMYAKTKEELSDLLFSEFYPNREISRDGMIIREKVDILQTKTYNGESYSQEYRFIFYDNKLLAQGFYHSFASEEFIKNTKSDAVPVEALELARQAQSILSLDTLWNTVDIAMTANGPIAIEANYGGSSGLPYGANKESYYKALTDAIYQDYHKQVV